MWAVSARVSMPVMPTMLRFLQPGVELFGGAVVGGVGDVGPEHDAADARERRHVHRLDVLVVGADVADMGEGEGDDLAGVGGVGQDLLVAGHRGVEADLARGVADRADAAPFEARAVARIRRAVAGVCCQPVMAGLQEVLGG